MLFLAAVLVATTRAPADLATQLTGCLAATKGTFYFVQEGSAPSEPCSAGDRTITWSITGPAGVQGPPGPPAPAPPRFRFVGVTTQVFQGSGTRAAMNAACASRFQGGRMAFSDEVTTAVPTPPIAACAWVEPRVTARVGGYGLDAAGNTLLGCDGSGAGAVFGGIFNCQSWSSSDPTLYCGPRVCPAGDVRSISCSVPLAVACSAPE